MLTGWYDFPIRIDALIPSSSLELTIPEVLEGEDPKAGWGWIGARTDLLRCGENQRNVFWIETFFQLRNYLSVWRDIP